MEYKYAAFISYRHAEADSAIAKSLHTQIERYIIPKGVRRGDKKLGRVFRDVEELSAASDLSEEICRALDASEHLIVICSENAIQSPWVTREVEYFLSGHDRSKVITVLASGEPGKVFPRALTHIENPDGTFTEIEPLAVDVRAKSVSGSLKKVKQEIYRLFAAMLGCPYDALVMREQTRQRRRIFSVASVVLALVLSFTGLVLVKNLQIDRKNAELEIKNQTLEQQKNEILLRESELLTAKAQEELENGNRSDAIRSALSALEDESGSRPYYPPAEGALLDALGIMNGRQGNVPVKITLSQNLPVEHYCVSTDGSFLASVDDFGWITCFDTSTGEILWTREEGLFTKIFAGPDNTLLINASSKVRACRFGDGEEVWEFSAPDFRSWVNVIGISDDLSQMALYTVKHENGGKLTNLSDGIICLTFINTADGSIRCEVANTEAEEGVMNSNHYSGGVFSSDKNTYIGILVDSSEEDSQLRIFSVDLKNETLNFHYSQPAYYLLIDAGIKLFEYSEDENTLIVLRDYSFAEIKEGSGRVGILEKYDLTSNQQLWQTEIIIDAKMNEYDGLPWDAQASVKDGFLVVSLGGHMAFYEMDTGSLIHTHKSNAAVSYVEVIEYPLFRYVLEDGEYGYAWIGANGRVNAEAVESTLTGGTKFSMWKDGFLEIEVVDGSVESIEPTGSGFIAAVPEDADNTIIVSRTASLDRMVEHTQIMDAEIEYISFETRAWTQGDMLVVGPTYKDMYNSDDEVIFVTDKDSAGDVVTIDLPWNMVKPEQIFILPDLSGYLIYDEGSYTTVRFDLSGNTYKMHSEDISVDEWSLYQNDYRYANALRGTDNAVLTARADEDSLTIWLNETQLDNVTVLQYADDPRFNSVDIDSVVAGENGYVLASVCSDNVLKDVSGILIYNTMTGEHKVVDAGSELDLTYPGVSIVCGKTEPLAALIDKGGNAYIFNLESGEKINCFPLQLAGDSISQVQFAHNDSLLLIMTNDSRLWGFDIETGGAVICLKHDEARVYDTLFVETDSSGKRMYICWNGGGVCIETTDWTVLSEMQDIIGYDANRESIVYAERLPSVYKFGIFGFRVPDTEELIDIGKEVLSID